MDRETFNGYTNYSTWAVCVWLENSKRKMAVARAVVERIVTEPVAGDDPVWGEAAQAVRNWVEAQLPAGLQSPAAELLGSGLSEVNWLEVAALVIPEDDPRARAVRPRDLYTVTVDLDCPALDDGGEVSTFLVAAVLRKIADAWEASDFVPEAGPVYDARGRETARTERTGRR